MEFTHKSFLDQDRKPARMRITSVRNGSVYYTYANEPSNKGAWFIAYETWITRYGTT